MIGSIWTGTTPNTDFPELEQEIKTDILIIGGGIAGLNVAYFLKNQNFKVTVLEANRIATGTSGNTTAKVTSLHELRYANLLDLFGKDKAQIYADSHEWAIKELENIIKKEKIDCDFKKAPAITYTRTKDDVDKIKQEVEAAKKLHLQASFVTSAESVPFDFAGAIKFDDQAYFHPRKYLLALAKLINDDGSNIFEQTRAIDIKEKEGFCEVKTDKKNIKAKFVIIATNLPFYDPDKIFAKLQLTQSYALAATIKTKYPQGMFIGTKEQDLSFRPHQIKDQEWLIIGGKHKSKSTKLDVEANIKQLEDLAAKTFSIDKVEYRWGAQDTMSLDKIAYIGRMPESKNIFVSTGFSAWGMTTSLVSARLITDLIINKNNKWQELYDPERLAKQKAKNKEVQKITVIPKCTFEGCTVDWNEEENVWICPCCGSRYSFKGKVLKGPATKDLAKI